MKWGFFFVFILTVWQGGGNSLTRIAETNRLKKAAADAYMEERYAEAAAIYETLRTKWGDESDAVKLNHAHALLRAEEKEKATEAYRQIAEGAAGRPAKSVALQQLGFLASEDEKQLQNALQYFKEALKADPANESARMNYELAWKRLNEQQDNEQKDDQQQQEDQPKIEPSEWARQQKAKADALSRQFRYTDALRLMQESMEQDSTIAAYNDYISRLGDVAEIDE
jgi:tetratricopeptide (TPR) repeat protein